MVYIYVKKCEVSSIKEGTLPTKRSVKQNCIV